MTTCTWLQGNSQDPGEPDHKCIHLMQRWHMSDPLLPRLDLQCSPGPIHLLRVSVTVSGSMPAQPNSCCKQGTHSGPHSIFGTVQRAEQQTALHSENVGPPRALPCKLLDTSLEGRKQGVPPAHMHSMCTDMQHAAIIENTGPAQPQRGYASRQRWGSKRQLSAAERQCVCPTGMTAPAAGAGLLHAY